MAITVRNQADVPKKYERLTRRKLHQLKRKFQQVVYANAHIRVEGNRPALYYVNLTLGVPGKDIFIQNRSSTLNGLIHETSNDAARYLTRNKDLRIEKNKTR